MKKLIGIFLIATMAFLITACGGNYICYRCDKNVSIAYYDMDGNINSVLCSDCAKSYWAPFDYTEYRVK